MADLTDSRVVFELKLQALVGAQSLVDFLHWSDLAAETLLYNQRLQVLMATALAETPGTAQEAVYQRQVEEVEENVRWKEATGIGMRSTLLNV